MPLLTDNAGRISTHCLRIDAPEELAQLQDKGEVSLMSFMPLYRTYGRTEAAHYRQTLEILTASWTQRGNSTTRDLVSRLPVLLHLVPGSFRGGQNI